MRKRLCLMILALLAVALGARGTVTTQNTSASFACTGGTGPFPFAFPINDATALTVVENGSPLATTNYTILPVNNNFQNGGNVTLNTACPWGQTLVLQRNTPLTQASILTDNMPLPFKTFERGLDKLTEIDQEFRQLLANLPIPSIPGYTVLTAGAKCDEVTDDTIAFLNGADHVTVGGTKPGMLVVPAGLTCFVNGHPNFTQAGLTIQMTGATITSSNTDYIFEFSGSGQSVVGGTFSDNTLSGTRSTAVVLGPANQFTIKGATVTSTVTPDPVSHWGAIGLLSTNLGTLAYSPTMADSSFSHNVIATGNTCNATNPNLYNQCLYAPYAKSVVFSSNIINGYGDAIQYWGGDANANGALTNPRLLQGFVAANNTVTNGAIWGSMGDQVALTGNIIKGCPDVCLDFEGTFNGSASGGSVADGTNGGLATFYQNRNIVFSGIAVTTHTYTAPLVYIAGLEDTPTQNKEVSFLGNTFTNLDPTGIAAIGTFSTSVEKLIFKGNTVRDAALYFNFDILGVEVAENSFTYDQANGSNRFDAVALLRSNQCGSCQTIPPMQAVIRDNVITSNAAQVSGSTGIHVNFGDSTHDGYGTADIEGNKFEGSDPFPTDILTGSGYAYTAQLVEIIEKDNNLAIPLITNSLLGWPPQTVVIQTANVDETTGHYYAADTTPLGPDLTVVNPIAPAAAESLYNPTFATSGAGWIPNLFGGTGWDATFAAGSANWNSTGGNGRLGQLLATMAIPAIPNAWYRFSYTVTASTGSPVLTVHSEFAIPSGGIYIWTTLGAHTIDVQANSAPSYFVLFASGTGTFSISPVSLKLLGGNIKAQGTITALEGFDSPGDIDAAMYASVSAAITALPAVGGVIHASSPLVNMTLGTLDPGTKAVTLFLGPYSYTATQISLRSNLQLIGDGLTSITSVGTNATPLIVFPQSNSTTVSNVVSQDIQFIGAAGNTSQEGMFIDVSGLTASQILFSRFTGLLFSNFKGRGIHLKGRPSDVSSTIQQSYFEGVNVEMPSGRVGEALRMEGEMGQLSFETCNFSVPSGADAYDDIYAGPSGSSATSSPFGIAMHNTTMGGGAVGLHLGGVQNFTMDVGWFESIPTDVSVTQDSASLGAASNVGLAITHSLIIGGAATAIVSDTDSYSAVSFNTNGIFYTTPGAFITGSAAANVEYCNNKGWAGALGCYRTPIAVGSLPSCSSANAGALLTVNNNVAACTYLGTPTAAGAYVCPVICNGTVWLIH